VVLKSADAYVVRHHKASVGFEEGSSRSRQQSRRSKMGCDDSPHIKKDSEAAVCLLHALAERGIVVVASQAASVSIHVVLALTFTQRQSRVITQQNPQLSAEYR